MPPPPPRPAVSPDHLSLLEALALLPPLPAPGLVALALVAVLGLAGLLGCSPAAGAPPPPPPPVATGEAVAVRVAAVAEGPVARPVRAAGRVQGAAALGLGFEGAGTVTSVGVDVGSEVRRGQVLARLDPTLLEAARVQTAAGAERAERDLGRALALRGAGAVAAQTSDDALSGARLARAQLAAARRALAGAVIVAPADGRIDARLVEPGEVVGPGQTVLRLSTRGSGPLVRATVADGDRLAVAPGQRGEVTLDARPGEVFEAVVTEVATVASPLTGGFEVELRVAGLPGSTPSGLAAKVSIERAAPAAALVPVGALVEGDGDRAAVFVVREGRARRVPVVVAFLHGGQAALVAALADRTVVTDGASRLTDGRAVDVRP